MIKVNLRALALATILGIGAWDVCAQYPDDSAAPSMAPIPVSNTPALTPTPTRTPRPQRVTTRATATPAPTPTPTPAAVVAVPDDDSAEPVSTTDLTSEAATPQSELVKNNFISMPDLAERLRKTDRNTNVSWDGRVLRINCAGQQFSIFPNSTNVVVNGQPDKVTRGITFDSGEIFVSPELNDFISRRTGNTPPPPVIIPETSITIVMTPKPEPTPTPAPTPTPMIDLAGTSVPLGFDDLVPVATPGTAPTTATIETPPSTPPENEQIVITLATPQPEVSQTPEPSPTPEPTAAPKPIIEITPAPAIAGSRFDILRQEAAHAVAAEKDQHYTATSLLVDAKTMALSCVVIDPDPASAKDDTEAAVLTMRFCKDLEASLKQRGVQTVWTSQSGNGAEVTKRLQTIIENRKKAQVVLSVRIALSPGKSNMQGPRVFTMNESVDAYVLDPLNNDAVRPDQVYRVLSSYNRTLGTVLNRALHPDAEDTKPMPLNSWIGHRSPMPYVILEVGNLSNTQSAAALRQDGYLETLADTVSQALIGYSSQQISQQQGGKL